MGKAYGYHLGVRRVGRLGVALVVGACAWAVSRAAAGQEVQHVLGSGVSKDLLLAIPVILLPSALGPEVAFDSASRRDNRFVVAWPLQFPIPPSSGRETSHRAVAALELALGTANGARWRGRVGYRHAGDVLIAGAGAGVDAAAWFVSPELGVRLPRRNTEPGFHPYATLILRGDVPPFSGERTRVSLMLGWIAF